MKFRLFVLACVAVFAIGIAPTAMAGSIVDTDGDTAPDIFDNCATLLNAAGFSEPGVTCNDQEDVDLDGFGQICDPDFDQSGDVQFNDFLDLVAFLGTADALRDLDCDGSVQFADFLILVSFLGQPPG